MAELTREIDNMVTFLRATLTDYNTNSRTGNEWIYPDAPINKISDKNQYPRVGVDLIDHNAEQIGCGSDETMDNAFMEIMIVTVKDNPLNIGSNTFRSGMHLCDQIAGDIKKAITENWRTHANLSNLQNMEFVNRDRESDMNKGTFTNILRYQFLGFNIDTV